MCVCVCVLIFTCPSESFLPPSFCARFDSNNETLTSCAHLFSFHQARAPHPFKIPTCQDRAPYVPPVPAGGGGKRRKSLPAAAADSAAAEVCIFCGFAIQCNVQCDARQRNVEMSHFLHHHENELRCAFLLILCFVNVLLNTQACTHDDFAGSGCSGHGRRAVRIPRAGTGACGGSGKSDAAVDFFFK